MSYTPSEGHGAKAEGRRGVPRSEGGDPPEHSKQPSPQDSLRQREIEDLAQRLPRWYRKPISAKQYRLMRELFLRFELFGVIDERNGSEGVPPPEEAGTLF